MGGFCGAAVLAKALETNSTITKIDLSGINIDSKPLVEFHERLRKEILRLKNALGDALGDRANAAAPDWKNMAAAKAAELNAQEAELDAVEAELDAAEAKLAADAAVLTKALKQNRITQDSGSSLPGCSII
jgi:hypothetical protein